MSQTVTFADPLDAAESLDPDSQAELVAILNRRLAERGRERFVESKPMTAAEIIRETHL